VLPAGPPPMITNRVATEAKASAAIATIAALTTV